jgi:hypothetical protein
LLRHTRLSNLYLIIVTLSPDVSSAPDGGEYIINNYYYYG